jgi:hypothetical protein
MSPSMLHRQWCRAIFQVIILINSTNGFKWKIDDTLDPMQILTLSERYMFASGEGPLLLGQGDSYIHVKSDVNFRRASLLTLSST